MRIVMFYHSLISDWNHGNAHFLRGVASELTQRGHEVCVYEPADSWSVRNLLADCGPTAIDAFRRAYPGLSSQRYALPAFDLERALDRADLVLVHEWNEPELIARIGAERRKTRSFRLLFHDTHHRAATEPDAMARFDLRDFDGVLAFGKVICDLYRERGWAQHAFVWHEAADTRRFRPKPELDRQADLVWIGNFGDDERSAELREYLIEPVRSLGLRARVHGVRYPEPARAALASAGIDYGGFLPNHDVPDVFARHRCTVHVPRRPYAERLPGIPTIRVFEALACGIPLVSAPWQDVEGLFTPGDDFLMAQSGAEMTEHLRLLRRDPELGQRLAEHGRQTIVARHSCAHRVDELLAIHAQFERQAAA
jgi:spore maturation protein CgeB